MRSPFDDGKMGIPCTNCGKVLTETIGKLRQNPTLVCSCKTKITINANELNSAIEKTNREIKNFERSLKKMFK